MRQTKKGLTDYYTESEDDAYGYLRDIVRRHGGRMWHDKKGNPHGAWKVRLNGQTTEFKGTGMGNLPDLDKYYVPKRRNPRIWKDYKDVLVRGAEGWFLRDLIKKCACPEAAGAGGKINRLTRSQDRLRGLT